MSPSPMGAPENGAAPRKTRSRWLVPVGALVAALILALGLGYRYWTSTPQYSLLQARNAFQAHDLNLFEKYVALDACADSLTSDVFDQASAKMDQHESDPNSPFAAAGRKMAQGLMMMLKPMLSGMIKTKARELVSTGQMTSLSPSQVSGPVDLQAIERSVSHDGLHYEGLGNVAVEGDTAEVELRFHNDKRDQEQPIELEMRRAENHWQVTRWKNATQWLQQQALSKAP